MDIQPAACHYTDEAILDLNRVDHNVTGSIKMQPIMEEADLQRHPNFIDFTEIITTFYFHMNIIPE